METQQKLKINPRYKVMILVGSIEGRDSWGEIGENYINLVNGMAEYNQALLMMENPFNRYVEFENSGIVYRIIRNPKYRQEGYN